ncbi:hypothetical protein HYH02_013090 [Chlamydomonas schloesseri]|uniref:Uncharacterized protein n=1 Tax=Chlamydomonas schloesseri TaxID=2026947 RepID=A0A835T5E4_9CHLO|nr:hypothetical protein HYH02_013090 [Chlamydomonas schloesseri]|eukprot:KAG2432020.1 hypothetical protein HYH02_013090 [Chlamydomonas schloesseri]
MQAAIAVDRALEAAPSRLPDSAESQGGSAKGAEEVLALPEPRTSVGTGGGGAGGVQTLTVGGGKITLDELGPAIVAEDGTLRRIANWAQLTERERQVALRRIGQRNQERIAALKQQQEQQEPEKDQQHQHQQQTREEL